jgi:isocitrate dehydrogenase (NAD+)
VDRSIEKDIQKAVADFEVLLREQYARNERIRESAGKVKDGAEAGKVVIGMTAGDGIGPVIMKEAEAVLQKLLAEKLAAGEVELKKIEGFTLENRLEKGQTVPDEVLAEMKQCDVLLKGPTTTPNASMNTKNLESANVYLRKAFDLYANVRPVSIPEEGIDWTFFRENTEGEYALGSRGVRIGDALDVDFKVTTREGTLRIARAAYEFARANGKKRVSIVTKANIMKKTDGDFLRLCKEVAEDYPEIETDNWFIDIMAANLVNKDIRSQFQVFVLPNLYGDIITDEAAQIQGGVGTAGSANIGSDYALFEAIHGSAPRMVEDGIEGYANPASLMKATAMMLSHIGYVAESQKLEKALDAADAKIGARMTGLPGGGTCREFADLVLQNL